MAASPRYKVYTSGGEYVASCKDASIAAILVSGLGDGTTIRIGHSKKDIVWTEGAETQSAGDSYDHVAEVVDVRQGRMFTERLRLKVKGLMRNEVKR